MTDLGTLGGEAAFGEDVSDNGQIVVGVADNANGNGHAFRWKSSTGMVDLGTLGGGSSAAWGVSSNGNAVVGQSYINATVQHAFRWTSGGMLDLGTLGAGDSVAYDVSGDGNVVVGYSGTTAGGQHAFRWTSAGMTDLGTLGGLSSQANAVSGDGSTVVGWGEIVGALGGARHAFRWTSSGGMSDLGTLDSTNPGANSIANGTSDDGSVVVGWSNAPTTGARAFRWTSATGMQNLNSLLSNAGVNMTGITLTFANAVSSKGDFIVGQGDFPGAPNNAFLVRYDDGTRQKGSVVAGVTTPDSVQTSVNDLGRERQQDMILQNAFANPVLETSDPKQQLNFGNGFYLLTNVAFSGNDNRFSGDDGLRASVAVRYLPDGVAGFRPLVEVGGWTEPDAAFSFQRGYANGSGFAYGQGFTSGSVSNSYARTGVVWEATANNRVSFTGEVDGEWSNVGAYAEQVSSTNPFEAYVSSGTDLMYSAKMRLEWLHRFGQYLDAGVWAAGGESFGDTVELSAAVPLAGTGLAPVITSVSWAEYGGRVGVKVGSQLTADLSFAGVSDLTEVNTSAQFRAAARWAF